MAKTAAPAETVQTEADNTICGQLLTAIRQHKAKFPDQKKTETDAAFIERVLQAIADVPDEIYNALSEEAKEWFAEAAKVVNREDGGVPDAPEGFVSAYKPPVVKEAPAKKLIERKPAAPAAQEPAPEPPAPTMGKLIRIAMINNKNATVAELETMLAQAGFTDIKRSTVFSFQRGSLDTLKVAEEMGRFSWPVEAQAEAAE